MRKKNKQKDTDQHLRQSFPANIDGSEEFNKANKEMVNHPNHYQFGENNQYEAIKVIDAWGVGFCLGNTLKYISRAGKKEKNKELEDLKKALWYLQYHIETLEKEK